MNLDLVLKLLRQRKPLAARLRSEQVDMVAWVGVYPLDASRLEESPVLRRLRAAVNPHAQPVFRIRVIEVSQSLLDTDRWLCEDDIHSREDVVVVGESALFEVLDRLGVEREALEYPNDVDYPI